MGTRCPRCGSSCMTSRATPSALASPAAVAVTILRPTTPPLSLPTPGTTPPFPAPARYCEYTVSLDPGTADFDDYRGKFIVHTLSRGEKKTIAMYIKIIGDTDQEPNESVKVEVLAQGKNGAGTVVEQSPVTNGEFWIVNDDWPVPHGQDSPPTVSHKGSPFKSADGAKRP